MPIRTLSQGLIDPLGLFATIDGDIYVDNGQSKGQVDKWTPNATNSTVAMYVSGKCWSLFVDIYKNIYCCVQNSHRVMKRSFNDSVNTTTTIAGNGSRGLELNLLNKPRGIFVDLNLNLYVADGDNHRILMFRSDQLNGTLITTGTILLDTPRGIVLDGDGYLFIADSGNHRVIGSNRNGFRCIIGCSQIGGNQSDQLNLPYGLSFDSYGNLYVADTNNNRIQKFLVAKSSGKYTLQIRIVSEIEAVIKAVLYIVFLCDNKRRLNYSI